MIYARTEALGMCKNYACKSYKLPVYTCSLSFIIHGVITHPSSNVTIEHNNVSHSYNE